MIDKPVEGETGWQTGARDLLPSRLSFLLRYRHRLRPVLSRKYRTAGMVNDFARSFPPDATVVNIGAGAQDYSVINLDIAPAVGIHLCGAAEHLPLQDESCDGYILQAVLEHVENAEMTLSEAYRVLKPGGRLLIEVPFMQGFHAGPQDHRRFTLPGLAKKLEQHGFDVASSGVAVGPGSAMAAITAEFLALLVSGRSRTGYNLVRLVTSWVALPLKFLDRWLERHPMAYVIASGVWAEASKPSPCRTTKAPPPETLRAPKGSKCSGDRIAYLQELLDPGFRPVSVVEFASGD